MDARILRVAVLVAAFGCLGASQRTTNFIVTAPTAEQAGQIATAAEKFRHDLAVEWLGHEMPAWGQPCPITAQVGDRLGAGGATSFLFEHGEVFGWKMSIQGSQERILDSVLPHEVTHTIFATHFRRPLPRWADEGACTTVEHASERTKQQVMLVDFLRNGRGIAFSRMFVMKEYPHDVMPLYSQGYSLARYLIAKGGKQKFLTYLADGMQDENWQRATRQHYGFDNLAMLQDTWLDWVRRGSPALPGAKPTPGPPAPTVLADNSRRPRPEPNLIYRAQSSDDDVAVDRRNYPSVAQAAGVEPAGKPAPGPAAVIVAPTRPGAGWHAAEGEAADETGASRPAPNAGAARAQPADENRTAPGTASGAAHNVTQPQGAQQPRQVILEWSKPPHVAEPAAQSPATTDENRPAQAQPFGR
jgi:hypothetical protein